MVYTGVVKLKRAIEKSCNWQRSIDNETEILLRCCQTSLWMLRLARCKLFTSFSWITGTFGPSL